MSTNDVKYETGVYTQSTVDRNIGGLIVVSSEPGRTILVQTQHSRLFLDARDIPSLVGALQRAQLNAESPVPQGTESSK